MKNLIYFIEFLIICLLFLIFRIIGYEASSKLGNLIGKVIGPKFRSKKVIEENIKLFNPSIKDDELNGIIKKCGVIMDEF